MHVTNMKAAQSQGRGRAQWTQWECLLAARASGEGSLGSALGARFISPPLHPSSKIDTRSQGLSGAPFLIPEPLSGCLRPCFIDQIVILQLVSYTSTNQIFQEVTMLAFTV